MTPRDELRAYLEKLKALERQVKEAQVSADFALDAAVSNPSNSADAYSHAVDYELSVARVHYECALRSAAPLLLEMAERALECDGCQGSGLRFQLWVNPVINEPCSCTPRITRWAELLKSFGTMEGTR